MNENRLLDYLDHIQQAAADVCSFVEGLAKDDFLADKRTQQAVIISLIIGEAFTKVMDSYTEFTLAHAQVPWRSMRGMRGMRNRIAHGYFDINLDVVWETVQTALPDLLKILPAVRQDACSMRGWDLRVARCTRHRWRGSGVADTEHRP